MNVPIPQDEANRLRALRGFGLLDTPPEEAFDRISSFAARMFEVPVALVTLIDEDRQFIKSCYGIDVRETSREMAFCAHTIMSPEEPLVVEDARQDSRFRNHPMVVGEPGIRFYAGVPIMAQEQSAIGSFCIVDWEPRKLSCEELRNLQDMARFVEDQIRLHDSRNNSVQAEAEIRALNVSLERSMTSLKDSLKQTIPHELLTPLNGVVGFSQILKQNWEELPRSEVRRLIDFLCTSGERLERSVRRLCTLNELQLMAGEGEEIAALRDCESLHLGECVEAALQNEPGMTDRLSDVDVSIKPVRLAIPENHLSTLLAELLDNAVKFSSGGSSIRIVGEYREGEYSLSISDSGRGMTSDQISCYSDFLQFERDVYEQQGMGLGLSLVNRICSVLEIDFAIVSPSRRGITAALRFPGWMVN